MGAKPGAEDAIAAVGPSMASEPDGVLIAPGLLARTAHQFGRRGAVFGIADGERFVDNLTAIGRTAVRSIVHGQG
jgi:hypothetical protein